MARIVLLLTVVFSLFSYADDEDFVPSEEVIPGTISYNNITEVRNFILMASEYDPELLQMVADIDGQLKEKDIHWHDTKDIFGEYNAEGRTYRTTRQSFRADRILPKRPLILFQSDARDMAAGTQLLNVVVHEYYHYKDYSDAYGAGTSPENSAYQRGYQTMLNMFWHFMLSEALVDEGKSPILGDLWKARLRAYAIELSRELNSYLQDEYGPLQRFAAPLAFKACVRDLERQEMARVLRDFHELLGKKGTIAEHLDALEKTARFKYATDLANASCITSISESGTLQNTSPVGYGGPRKALAMFSVNLPAGHKLTIEKLSGGNDIFIDAGEEEVGTPVKKFVKKGGVYAWETKRTISFEKEGRKVIIVSQRNDIDQSVNFNLKFTGVYTNANNQDVEYDLLSQPVSNTEIAQFGYHPIYEARVSILFSDRSLGMPQEFFRQEAIEFMALEKDFLKISMPQVDNRYGRLYFVRDTPSLPTLPELELVTTFYAWINEIGYTVPKAGRYLFVIYRNTDFEDNTRFTASIQVSRNGATPPTTFQARRLNIAENADYGFHPPSYETTTVNYRKTAPQGFFGHFSYQAMLDLDVMPNDFIDFEDLAEDLNRTIYLVKLENNDLVRIGTLYPWMGSNRFRIEANTKHFLVFGSSELSEDASSQVKMRRWRYSKKGPSEAKIKWLTPAEQAAFGYFPQRTIDLTGTLTAESPKNFVNKDAFFKLYEVNVTNDKVRMILRSPAPTFQRRFMIYKVDEALFSAGQKSLKMVSYIYPWHNEMNTKFEASGRYILALEAYNANLMGSMPFRIYLSQIGMDPQGISIKELSNSEMMELRFRPIE